MTVPMDINSVVTVRHEYEVGSDIMFNVLHYRLRQAVVIATGLPLATVPVADVVLPSLANSAFAQWAAVWAPAASAQIIYARCTAQKVYTGTRSVPYTYNADPQVPGDQAGDMLPAQDAVTILKKTGIGQRWGNGRLFFTGIPEAHAFTGYVDGVEMGLLADLANLMDDELTTTVAGVQYYFRPVVTNVPTTGVPRVNDIVLCEVSNNIIKTQRRRRPGKGM